MTTLAAIFLAVNKTRALTIFMVVFLVIGLVLGATFLFRYCRLRLRDMKECPPFLQTEDKQPECDEEQNVGKP